MRTLMTQQSKQEGKGTAGRLQPLPAVHSLAFEEAATAPEQLLSIGRHTFPNLTVT